VDVRWDRLQNLLDPSQATIEFYESVFHLRAGQHRRSSNEFADPRGRWILASSPQGKASARTYFTRDIARGDATGSATLTADATTTAYLWLASVDVLATAAAIVAFGDSITDGVGVTLDSNRAWPSLLAEKLATGRAGPAIAVVNAGLSGNRLLRPGFGVSALARFDRDVLTHAGVRWMTVLLGINDITFPAVPGAAPAEAVTADDLIWGFQQIIERAHRHGVKVAGATITPVEGVNTYTETGEAIRQAVNRWIRTSGAFDAVIDFDAAVRDPRHPSRLRADSDRVHPNDPGNAAMASAIDASIFSR